MTTAISPTARKAYYFIEKYAVHEKKACRRYRVFDDEEQKLVEARVFRSLKPSPVSFSDDLEHPEIWLKVRKLAAFTGKVEVLDAKSGALMGVATRGYKLFDQKEEEIGRFLAESDVKDQLGQAAAELAIDLLFQAGGEGLASAGRKRRPQVLMSGDKAVARLFRMPLPFFPDPPRRREAGPVTSAAKKLLSKFVPESFLKKRPPIGWCFEVFDEEALPSVKVLLASLLIIIDMREWATSSA